jgi:hypothetical protein
MVPVRSSRWQVTSGDWVWFGTWLAGWVVILLATLVPGASSSFVLLVILVEVATVAAGSYVISRFSGHPLPKLTREMSRAELIIGLCVFAGWWLPFLAIFPPDSWSNASGLAAYAIWMSAGWQIADLVGRAVVGRNRRVDPEEVPTGDKQRLPAQF